MAEENKENTTPQGEEKDTETPPPSDDEGKDKEVNENEDDNKKDDENDEGGEDKDKDDVNPEDVDLNNPNAVSEALDKKGIDYNSLAEEYMANGKLKDETIAGLEAAGIPRNMIDGYIKGYEARVELEQNELGALVGGRDKLEEIKNWAASNLTREKIISLNNIRDRAELELVLIGLKASMEDKEGKTPDYQKGTGDKVAETGYRSKAEMYEAIRNPKYRVDEAYRADVMKKIAASREAGIDLGIY